MSWQSLISTPFEVSNFIRIPNYLLNKMHGSLEGVKTITSSDSKCMLIVKLFSALTINKYTIFCADWLCKTYSVLNYRFFYFFNLKFDHCLIQKITQSITSFVVAYFINTLLSPLQFEKEREMTKNHPNPVWLSCKLTYKTMTYLTYKNIASSRLHSENIASSWGHIPLCDLVILHLL